MLDQYRVPNFSLFWEQLLKSFEKGAVKFLCGIYFLSLIGKKQNVKKII